MPETPLPADRLSTTGRLLAANIAVGKAIEEYAVRPLGLDRDTADLLVRLSQAENGSLRGVDISQQLMINPARTSRLIDRAEAQGLVIRQSDPSDRRAQLIAMTEDGEAALSELAPQLLRIIDRVVAQEFNVRELEVFDRLLDRIQEAAAAYSEA